MRFADIPGHEELKRHLRSMVDEGRLPHALLLFGAPGSGKLMLARALATYIHCRNRHDGDSCGQCPGCLQHAHHNHADLHYTFPTLKKKSEHPGESAEFASQWKEFLDQWPYAPMDAWLEKLDKPNGQPVIYKGEGDALAKDLSYTARSSDNKIAIVWLPERFKNECANKLLKLIEEPFPDTKLIFVSDDPQEILPTIYSRLQRVEVPRLDAPTVAQELMKVNPNVSRDEAEDVARAAMGNVNEARDMIAGGINNVMLDNFIALMRMAFQRNIGGLKKWSDDMAGAGREAQLRFLNFCCRELRENFINNTGITSLSYMTKPERDFSARFSKFINSGNVLPLTTLFEEAITDIQGNANAKIVFFDMAIHVAMLIKK